MAVRKNTLVALFACWVCFWVGCKPGNQAANKIDSQAGNIAMESVDEVEQAVNKCISKGYPIDLVYVTGHQSFTPSKGEEGAECNVTKVESISPGKQQIKVGQTVYLYPFTDAESVIVLSRENGNWLDSKYCDRVLELVDAKQMKASEKEKGDMNH